MSKNPFCPLSSKDVRSLRGKGFELKAKPPVVIVRCLQCNTEWSLHSAESRHEKITQLGRHFLGHLKQ